jgi:pimeloyl-ACP methyl ester carboxylesterase
MKKKSIRIASLLFPGIIANFAYKKLTNPQVRKLRENELITLDKAEKERMRFKEFDIQLYSWKGGDKKILLIHGWEGQAGNFSDIIEQLLSNGYTVYAFDGPSHGYSSKGKTSLFEFSDLVGTLIQKNNIKLLISHSFGGVATTFALYNNSNLQIDKYVLLTTPDKFIERIDEVSESVGISTKVRKRLIHRLEKETKMNVKALNVSGFVKFISVKKALIIHDKDDKVIPIKYSLNVHKNWNESEFKEVEGTGHFRILRSKEVIETIIDYLN